MPTNDMKVKLLNSFDWTTSLLTQEALWPYYVNIKASCSLAMEYRVNAPQIAVIIATKNRPSLLNKEL